MLPCVFLQGTYTSDVPVPLSFSLKLWPSLSMLPYIKANFKLSRTFNAVVAERHRRTSAMKGVWGSMEEGEREEDKS